MSIQRHIGMQKGTYGLLLKPLLIPASFLYLLAIKLWTLWQKIKRPGSLPGLVISIGNLTTGGTGKTPAVTWLAAWAKQTGYRVAVLSRGYGGHYHEKILEVQGLNSIKTGPSEAGDEPCLMAEKLPGIPIVLSKKRLWAGEWARQKYRSDFFIMDDGFQHRALKRDLDLVLLDATEPLQHNHLLPWGLLREPRKSLNRAHVFIITRSEQQDSNQDLEAFLHTRFPGKPVFKSMHQPDQLIFPYRQASYDPQDLRGKRVLAFAGIGKPQAFKTTLVRLGAEIVDFESFDDHYPFEAAQIDRLAAKAKALQADFLVTTEKDWMRIKALGRPFPDLAYLTIQFRLTGDQDLFFDQIKKKAKEVVGY